SPLADMLGVVSEGAEAGRARFRVAAGPGLYNPNGVLHGGVIYVMVDSSMGAAVMGALEPGLMCTTIELKVSYLQAVREGEITCESEVTKLGRNIAFVDSRVRDDQDRIVATASGTMFILRPKAEG
ncbi:MAG: PaaI family thioesterase, partial [Dehalococcoidia bacterium]